MKRASAAESMPPESASAALPSLQASCVARRNSFSSVSLSRTGRRFSSGGREKRRAGSQSAKAYSPSWMVR